MSLLPVIALVGRPNVGKSTVFNTLTRTRDAIVADQPGLTRDRQFGIGRVGELPYLVLDTGGLSGDDNTMDALIAEQVWKAITEADIIFFIVDGRSGLSAFDEEIAVQLRKTGKPCVVVVNKAEDRDESVIAGDFYSLGMGNPVPISAAHSRGLYELISHTYERFPSIFAREDAPIDEEDFDEDEDDTIERPIRLAVIGRPNAGKSTLINRILGEERVLASDIAGTTRDSIEIPFENEDRQFILIDTAGIRRRSRVDDKIEKFSVIKSIQALERSNVVVFVFDAHEGLSDQDASLLGHVLDSGRALVLAVNKWDHLPLDEREWLKTEFDRKFAFIDFAKPIFISALHGTGVDRVLKEAIKAYDSARRKFTTNELSNILEMATHKHHAPIVQGFAPKLRYAHQGGRNPPRFIIHGNRIKHIKEDYIRYLMNTFRSALKIEGTPIRLEFRSGDNPFAHVHEKPLTKVQADKLRKPAKRGTSY